MYVIQVFARPAGEHEQEQMQRIVELRGPPPSRHAGARAAARGLLRCGFGARAGGQPGSRVWEQGLGQQPQERGGAA